MKRVFVLLLFLMLVGSVDATVISIEDSINSKHSLGEVVKLEFSISSEAEGFVESYLKCDSNVLVDKRYEEFDNYTRDFEIDVPLLDSGDCRFLVEFDSEEAESDLFEVGDEIEINYELNNIYFKPGEELVVEGNATKFNGDIYEGVVDFSVGDVIEKKQETDEGEFIFRYRFREDVFPGEYNLILSASEVIKGDIKNFGKEVKEVYLDAIPYYLEIDSVDEIKPPANLSFRASLLDQGKREIENESVVVRMYAPSGRKIYEESIKSGSRVKYELNKNFSTGKISIRSYFGSISNSKAVYVLETRELDVFFEEGSLVFMNKGNAPYEGIANFTLERDGVEDRIFLNLSLDVGQSYVYEFQKAGMYNVSVFGKDFLNENVSVGSSITGAFIGADVNWQKVIVSVLFILILGSSGVFVFIKRKRLFARKEGRGVVYESSLTPVKVKKSMKKNLFLIFVVGERLERHKNFLSTRGLNLRKINSQEGYVVTFKEDTEKTHRGLINLAKQVMELEGVKTIVLNSSHVEKDVSKVKEFVLFNRDIASRVDGVFVFGDFLKYIDRGKKDFLIDGQRIQGAII